MLGEPQDEEDATIIVERPQPSISAHKKIFQTVDNFIGIGHYVGRYVPEIEERVGGYHYTIQGCLYV